MDTRFFSPQYFEFKRYSLVRRIYDLVQGDTSPPKLHDCVQVNAAHGGRCPDDDEKRDDFDEQLEENGEEHDVELSAVLVLQQVLFLAAIVAASLSVVHMSARHMRHNM